MRTAFVFVFLFFCPIASWAQEDLKCDVKKPGYAECDERQWKSYLGKYFCVIDHVAGIQYDEDDELGKSRPFVGRIVPREEKFFMEISEDASISCGMILPGPADDSCKTKYKMTIRSKSIFLRENAYSALIPQLFVTTGGKMAIIAGGRFRGNYAFGWNNYAFEGRCEKIN